ncbi:helix-turn-helix transcriptional regulator [Lutimaribacter marinistellae]|uniref:Helix-turn-helix transcriptional regulator n=1 Tax=Lutimaribacter marinistellae TaxID=1820329 RepID=A0ABV7TN11_9RHOB
MEILRLLGDGGLHTAGALAARLGVSQRTLYRDMEVLASRGVPVEGTRGSGYRLARRIVLPPLELSPEEMEALSLGLAIVGEATDPALKAAALGLADKVEAALPMDALPAPEAWKLAVNPLADAARGFAHVAPVRAAIGARQKLEILPRGGMPDVLRPLRLEVLGRIWVLTGWSETRERFAEHRLDLLERVSPLPALFTDEPGKRLEDYLR